MDDPCQETNFTCPHVQRTEANSYSPKFFAASFQSQQGLYSDFKSVLDQVQLILLFYDMGYSK